MPKNQLYAVLRVLVLKVTPVAKKFNLTVAQKTDRVIVSKPGDLINTPVITITYGETGPVLTAHKNCTAPIKQFVHEALSK